MTPIQLSRESRTFYLLDTYARVDKATDTCSLRWQMGRAFLTIMLIIVLGATIGMFVLDTVVWIFAMWMMGMFIEPSVLAVITVAVSFVVGALVGLAIAGDAYNRRKWRLRDEAALLPPTPPSAIKVAYRSLKEKYCAPVEFV